MARTAETAEDFLTRYLRAQDRFIHRYSSGYKITRQGVVHVMRTKSATIITTSGMGPRKRRRYTVRKRDGTWDLTGIELECSVCSGTGKVFAGIGCDLCAGAGWTMA